MKRFRFGLLAAPFAAAGLVAAALFAHPGSAQHAAKITAVPAAAVQTGAPAAAASGLDTDNVESGDQSSPDTESKAGATADPDGPAGPNDQQGDQQGPNDQSANDVP